MDNPVLMAIARTDDKALIEALLTAHTCRLRHAREFMADRRKLSAFIGSLTERKTSAPIAAFAASEGLEG